MLFTIDSSFRITEQQPVRKEVLLLFLHVRIEKKMFCSGKSINGWSSMSQADAHLFIHNHLSVVEIKINLTFIWLDWILCAWRSSFQFVILEKNQFILFWINEESDNIFYITEIRSNIFILKLSIWQVLYTVYTLIIKGAEWAVYLSTIGCADYNGLTAICERNTNWFNTIA